ncbi:MAG: glycosyltransferase family 2 protein [Deltaproteobacteria bacterium]|nr:glycosyltransferase family 2 protein [Deltaproteobacteria bacterium]MBW2141700.1 glycosyltransferase family 2 protein [Deltaproteobacteria bacterium]
MNPTLTVIIPVFNERETILKILDLVVAVDIDKEIIVVDDGSTDSTVETLKAAETRYPGAQMLYHDRNRGKGAAIRTALSKARGRFTIIQDADLEYDPKEYPQMLAPLLEGRTKAVYGSRILGSNKARSYNRYYWGGRLLSFVTNILYASAITDESTCYKAIETNMLRNLNLAAEGFEFCPEVTAKLLRAGVTIHEVPISYHPRSFEEGKKIKPKDGLIAIWTLIKYRFGKPPTYQAQ